MTAGGPTGGSVRTERAMPGRTRSISTKMSDSMMMRLLAICRRKDYTPAEAVRDAIREWVERQEQP
jgi:predicted transcriptional regulator